MSHMPLISVILPCHNNAPYLTEAIQSIQAQTHRNWEVLVLDDASTDGTESLVTEMAREDARIRYFKLEKQRSVYQVRNIGIEKARGEYIAFLDGDDAYYPKAFETLLEAFALTPEKMVIKGFHTCMDEESNPISNKGIALVNLPNGELVFPPGFQLDWPTILKAKFPCELGSGLYRREIFAHFGAFRDELTHTDDLGFFIRLFIQCPACVQFVPSLVLKYRAQRQSITKDPSKVQQVTDCHIKVLDEAYSHPQLPRAAEKLESWAYLTTYKRLARRQLNLGRPAIARNIAAQAWRHPKVKRLKWIPGFTGIMLQSYFPAPLYTWVFKTYKQALTLRDTLRCLGKPVAGNPVHG